VLPVHAGVLHVVPRAYCWHVLPVPQNPFRLQPDAPSSGHSLSGSVPTATDPQVPSVPAPFFPAVQPWQSPEHAVSQHTPSAQYRLDLHCAPLVHLPPRSCTGWQVPSAVRQ
jgi:hypothetical protein